MLQRKPIPYPILLQKQPLAYDQYVLHVILTKLTIHTYGFITTVEQQTP